jgi:hypothetical protein
VHRWRPEPGRVWSGTFERLPFPTWDEAAEAFAGLTGIPLA